jgi:hypothetical protein
MKQTKRLLMAIVVLTFCLGLMLPQALADSSGTSTGTATVTSAVPSISSVELWNSTETGDKNNTALDSSNVEYHLNFTVADTNTMADMRNVTIKAWDNRGQAEADVDSQRYHYTWTWINSTDTWACGTGASYITTGTCADPNPAALTAGSYEFRLAFKLSKVANYSNAGTYDGWQFKIYVYDAANNTGTYGQGTGGRTQFGVASYLSITITDATHAWSAAPNTNDNAITGDGKVDFTVIANRVWKAQVDGTQNLTKGSDIIGLGNVTQYGSDVVGSSVPLTFSYADVTGITSQAAPTDEAAPTAKGVYLWLDVPTGTPAGDYVYTLNIQVAAG